jgi:hypothetical protein
MSDFKDKIIHVTRRWIMSGNDIDDFKDELSRAAFGMTKAEAVAKQICVDCKEPAQPKCHTDSDRKEYLISGICGECFANMFREEQ